jgi:CheY-like chemotaxis protein
MNDFLSCFFPTTVVCVDDNAPFLESLIAAIKNPNITIKKFSNPSDALAYINESSEANRLDCSDLVRESEEHSSDWKSVLVNINLLHRKIYDPNRFSIISTVITDYSMPEMTGVELCANIKDKNIQKVLLTAIADEKIAIDAFNAGYISRFVKKDSNFKTELTENLNRSMSRYFQAYTDDLSKHFSVDEKTHLTDPVFARFFLNNYLLNKTYVEYYMLDNYGGYLFLDSDGQPNFLSMLTEREMNRIINIGIESGEIDDDVLEGLKSRKYILVSHNRFGQLPPIGKWGNYLKPARVLEGCQTYYFSFAEAKFLDIDFDRIKSFDSFLATQNVS